MAEPVSKRRAPVARSQWILAAAGVLMIGAAVWMTAIRHRPPAVPPPPAAHSDAAPLALYVQHDGAALRLHWDPDADAVRRASAGTLLISDGPRESKLNLSPDALRSGVASYWPESSGVTFRLELDGAPAGEIQAPATAAREEPRPSPFDADQQRPAPPPSRRPAVEEPDDGIPKPYTVRAADTPAPPTHADAADAPAAPSPVRPAKAVTAAPRASVAPPPPSRDADRTAKTEPEKSPAKPSRWRRMTRKIPLLRRLGGH